MNPGDVARVYFPFSYLEEEPYKRRPVVVVGGTPPGTPGDHAVLVAQITGDPRRVAHPRHGDVVVSRWQEANLLTASVVRGRRLWTPEPRDFAGPPFGRLDRDTLAEVLAEVRLLVSSIGA